MTAERTIATTIAAAIAARSYMTTNAVQVSIWGDNTAEHVALAAIVNAMPRTRLQPNYDKYRIELELQTMTHTDEDKDGTSESGITNDLQSWLDGQSYATLSTLTGLQIDGIVHQPNDQQFSENYRHQFVRTSLFLTLA